MQSILFSGQYAIRGTVYTPGPVVKPWEHRSEMEPVVKRIVETAKLQGVEVEVRPEELVEPVPGEPSSIQRILQGLLVFTGADAVGYRAEMKKLEMFWGGFCKKEQEPAYQLTSEEQAVTPATEEEFLAREKRLGEQMDQWLILMQTTPLTLENATDASGALTFSLADGQPLKK